MAQTEVKLDKPTTYYQPGGQKVNLDPGTHFIGEGWSTEAPTANFNPSKGGNFVDTMPKIVGSNDKINGIVSSSENIRDDINSVKSDATSGASDIDNISNSLEEYLQSFLSQPLGYGEDVQSQESEAAKMASNLGVLTSQEDADVQAQGLAAFEAYRPMITQAEEAKRKGLPKAVIGAGERGGFMSTQFAGGAALQQTEGETFIGAGGELSNIASEYDRNINLIVSAAMSARTAAMTAAKQAIKTGKREDLALMYDSIDRLKENQRMIEEQQQAKVNAIYQYSTFKQGVVNFNNALEDRTIAGEDRARNIAIDNFNNMLKFAGVEGIQNNKAGYEQMFKEIGWDVSVDDVITYLQTEEAKGNAPELRTSPDGDLISVKYNPDTEEFETEVIMKKTKTVSSGLTSPTDKLDKEFRSDIESGLDELESGRQWGTVWNNLYDQYKDKVEDQEELKKDLDRLLNKDFWSKPGAYREFKKSGVVPKEDTEETVQPFLNEDYLKNNLKLKGKNLQKALTKVETLRRAGYNDKEIVKELYNM